MLFVFLDKPSSLFSVIELLVTCSLLLQVAKSRKRSASRESSTTSTHFEIDHRSDTTSEDPIAEDPIVEDPIHEGPPSKNNVYIQCMNYSRSWKKKMHKLIH